MTSSIDAPFDQSLTQCYTETNKRNIDTRINKTIKGEYDAIILAVGTKDSK